MNEYKENTVGWQLFQLKEPLKSRALAMGHASLGEYSPSLKEAVEHIYELGEYGERDEPFWTGVQKAFSRMQPVYGNLFLGDKGWEGYNMARECAPDNWLKPKDGGEDKAIIDSPAPKAFEGFNKWMEAHGRPNLSSEELLNLNEYPKILYDETFLYPGESPKPKDSWEVEPAVIGYQVPLPVDTIEKKHELRIQNLELENKLQADEIAILKGSLDLVISKVGELSQRIEVLEARPATVYVKGGPSI